MAQVVVLVVVALVVVALALLLVDVSRLRSLLRLLLTASDHSNVIAQCNQMRRAIMYRLDQGEDKLVHEMGQKTAAAAGAKPFSELLLLSFLF